ncbi:MAG: tRNA dihydrouridine(20/20a) synthase DusA [Pseudomonadota bacterium]
MADATQSKTKPLPTVGLAAARRLSVAPMMEWTDRHCRFFHRRFSARALLYTEMVNAAGMVQGEADWLFDHDPAEHPLALQLGGAEPEMLARAVRLAAPRGFAEINLNVGCPSDRVQSGRFGAYLMREPALVADCVAAMIEAAGPAGPEITVKCRIGVDDQDPEAALPDFVDRVAAAGVRHVAVHARKAWLQGLSPKENRTIPPLDHALVGRLAAARPDLSIALNGGIESLEEARALLEAWPALSGVMIGRAAYHDPATILGGADAFITGDDTPVVRPETAVAAMQPYIAAHLARGGRLHQVVRHMLGAFAGRPGARAWRRVLSEEAAREGADWAVVERALAHVTRDPVAPALGGEDAA